MDRARPIESTWNDERDGPFVRPESSAGCSSPPCSGRVVDLGGANRDGTSKDGGAGGSGTGGSGATTSSGGVAPEGGSTTTPLSPPAPTVRSSSKLDLLLVVDNSASMGAKQDVLNASIPALVQRITGSASGIQDLHVGVITSSLGGHGAPVCPTANDQKDPLTVEEETDNAHLVATQPRYAGMSAGYPGALAPTADGYVAWQQGQDVSGLTAGIQSMIGAADEHGCGYEAPLEAMYRFLADPNPPKSIALAGCAGHPDLKCSQPTGRDDAVLAQRQSFLRPDSVVAVVMLTDENDCSVIDSGQGFLAVDATSPLPPATPECQANPNDKCCRSCRAGTPAGCQDQSAYCVQTEQTFSTTGDPLNLRCWEQKRRFGFDFLYPTQRYANALSQPTICPSRSDLDAAQCPDANNDGVPEVVANPLIWSGATLRDSSMIHFLAVVGVPWQDIATSTTGDLHFQTSAQLGSSGTWSKILGNAQPPGGGAPVAPTDALMIESNAPRAGNDGQGAPLLPPSTAGVNLSQMPNGHEWNDLGGADLEYACIFPLSTPDDCTTEATRHCDCTFFKDGDNGPLCQAPDGTYGTTQYYAKAYPGLRHLAVAQALGGGALVGSACARNVNDPTAQDYGYRPALDGLMDQVKQSTP